MDYQECMQEPPQSAEDLRAAKEFSRKWQQCKAEWGFVLAMIVILLTFVIVFNYVEMGQECRAEVAQLAPAASAYEQLRNAVVSDNEGAAIMQRFEAKVCLYMGLKMELKESENVREDLKQREQAQTKEITTLRQEIQRLEAEVSNPDALRAKGACLARARDPEIAEQLGYNVDAPC